MGYNFCSEKKFYAQWRSNPSNLPPPCVRHYRSVAEDMQLLTGCWRSPVESSFPKSQTDQATAAIKVTRQWNKSKSPLKPWLQLRYDYETTTTRRCHYVFDYDGSDRNYVRFDYDTTTTWLREKMTCSFFARVEWKQVCAIIVVRL